MMFFLELVQMRLQALLILQIVLEENILLGLRLYESIFDWWTTLTHHLTLLSCCLLWIKEGVIRCLCCVLWWLDTYVAHLTLFLRAEVRVDVSISWHLLRASNRHWLAESRRESNSDVTKAETEHLHIVIIAGKRGLRASGHRVPALAILVKVEILAPLDQIVYFIIEVFILHHFEFIFVEGVIIEWFKLFLEANRLNSGLVHSLTLLSDKLSVLGVSIELS